jgi:hypothetical protein
VAEPLSELPILECSLDAAGLAAQRERYARLARSVTASTRAPGELTVEFGPGLERDLLAEALDIERACCPFFELRLEGARLRVRVAEPHQEPALDAIAHVLGADGAAG